jgi:hypothetical protein
MLPALCLQPLNADMAVRWASMAVSDKETTTLACEARLVVLVLVAVLAPTTFQPPSRFIARCSTCARPPAPRPSTSSTSCKRPRPHIPRCRTRGPGACWSPTSSKASASQRCGRGHATSPWRRCSRPPATPGSSPPSPSTSRARPLPPTPAPAPAAVVVVVVVGLLEAAVACSLGCGLTGCCATCRARATAPCGRTPQACPSGPARYTGGTHSIKSRSTPCF